MGWRSPFWSIWEIRVVEPGVIGSWRVYDPPNPPRFVRSPALLVCLIHLIHRSRHVSYVRACVIHQIRHVLYAPGASLRALLTPVRQGPTVSKAPSRGVRRHEPREHHGRQLQIERIDTWPTLLRRVGLRVRAFPTVLFHRGPGSEHASDPRAPWHLSGRVDGGGVCRGGEAWARRPR